jgi:hypothetical protein
MERKSKFKNKRPLALNLEAAKQEIGIGDGAEHRLTPASPSWARQRFANRAERSTLTATPSSLSNEINDENTPPSSNNDSNTRASLAVPSKKRNARVAQLNLSNLSISPRLHVREPFDFAKRLREDYRRKYPI